MSDAAEGAFEFDRFEFVLLRRSPTAPSLPDEELERLQQLHQAHFSEMRAAEHLVVAGPFDEQPDETLRGLCLYHTGSVETARELAERDPMVVAGRLVVEVMVLYCEKGAIPVPWATD